MQFVSMHQLLLKQVIPKSKHQIDNNAICINRIQICICLILLVCIIMNYKTSAYKHTMLSDFHDATMPRFHCFKLLPYLNKSIKGQHFSCKIIPMGDKVFRKRGLNNSSVLKRGCSLIVKFYNSKSKLRFNFKVYFCIEG